MIRHAHSRWIGASLTMGAASLTVLALTAASASATPLYNGCSFGATPERAIQKAIRDAEISASGDGLFNCVIVGEPLVWVDGTLIRAAVDMACT
jgi:ApbE superfamily uncharacterized protein (UPF0280 family)